jgi:hypothetical protein
MKNYVDEKFWRMFSVFVIFLACSMVLLIVIKNYSHAKEPQYTVSTKNK